MQGIISGWGRTETAIVKNLVMSNNVLPRHGIANFLRFYVRPRANLLDKINCDSAYPPYSEFLDFGNT